MTVDLIQELAIELLVAAQLLTGYEAPDHAPAIEFVSHAELERKACDSPCEIYGWYPLGGTIYLDERLDPLNNLAARGILMHEIVHFLQESAGVYAEETPCVAWTLREREAYVVQARWLARQGSALSTPLNGPRPWRITC